MDKDQTASPYEPPPEFEQDSFEPLVDLNVDDSTELWLIQWPVNQAILFFASLLSHYFQFLNMSSLDSVFPVYMLPRVVVQVS